MKCGATSLRAGPWSGSSPVASTLMAEPSGVMSNSAGSPSASAMSTAFRFDEKSSGRATASATSAHGAT